MDSFDARLAEVARLQAQDYWTERLFGQLRYVQQLSKFSGGKYNALLEDVMNSVGEYVKSNQRIDRALVFDIERRLSVIQAECKKYTITCVAHAHIDMNWMWRWDETVAVTLNTFETMLALMREYPDFKFSQSQASVYKLVEDYAPEIMGEIKERIQQGRWEVTASTWVEPDKNMPEGESLTRQILYTKQYLSKVFAVDPHSLELDFEPDTFGHSVNTPEILVNGGVKYYYHCRGYDGHNIYRWFAPSGQSVLVYREPDWYNGEISPSMVAYVPDFCHTHGIDTMLKVYGVGDHGGGPTRRDLARILDMRTWPAFPHIEFGTLHEFFALLDLQRDRFPEVHGELNSVFTGCYTTQTRIKKANRVAETTLKEGETFSALAALTAKHTYSPQVFAEAWRNVLFNQFHDILPGSGVVDTREYAMGLFQNTMAIANTRRSMAMNNIAHLVDTIQLVGDRVSEPDDDSTSEGAGVGFGSKDFRVSQVERGNGLTRLFQVYNALPFERNELVELTIWDWQGDSKRMVCRDDAGQIVDHQLVDQGVHPYWGHTFLTLWIHAHVQACGYRTYLVTESNDYEEKLVYPSQPRVERIKPCVLENSYLRAEFDPVTGALISLRDKLSELELIDVTRKGGMFRRVLEDDSRGMTAWIVGQYMNIQNLTEQVKIKELLNDANLLRQSIKMEIKFNHSQCVVTASLARSSRYLNFQVECDWREFGNKGQGVPQLGFYMPLNYPCTRCKYDVPFGTVVRAAEDMDVPANSWALALPSDSLTNRALLVVSDSKYGFRCVDDSLSMTLIRSSFDPDPYPEIGKHSFSFAMGSAETSSNLNVMKTASAYRHPLQSMSVSVHHGELPTQYSFITLSSENLMLSAIKAPEDASAEKSMIIRMYETEGAKQKSTLHFAQNFASAYWVDLNEQKIVVNDRTIEYDGPHLHFESSPFSVLSLRVDFT